MLSILMNIPKIHTLIILKDKDMVMSTQTHNRTQKRLMSKYN